MKEKCSAFPSKPGILIFHLFNVMICLQRPKHKGFLFAGSEERNKIFFTRLVEMPKPNFSH